MAPNTISEAVIVSNNCCKTPIQVGSMAISEAITPCTYTPFQMMIKHGRVVGAPEKVWRETRAPGSKHAACLIQTESSQQFLKKYDCFLKWCWDYGCAKQKRYFSGFGTLNLNNIGIFQYSQIPNLVWYLNLKFFKKIWIFVLHYTLWGIFKLVIPIDFNGKLELKGAFFGGKSTNFSA